MTTRISLTATLAAALLVPTLLFCAALACCPAPPSGKPVVNADQTVIIIWDAASKTQHFIRQASFKSEADDFGFLVPTPSQPELNDSSNGAFSFLAKLTEPEKQKVPRPSRAEQGFGGSGGGAASVKVLKRKFVAGFEAVVLEAESAAALVNWLKDHGYAFSPEVEAWAKPYVEAGWKITALKVAKRKDSKEDKTVAASALRMSFKTDRPLFPYREPDPKSNAAALDAKHRLLRIYFVAESQYWGALDKKDDWTGRVAWANSVDAADRKRMLQMLKLPETTGPANWWLTEFEDDWPYAVAPGDLYFARSTKATPVKRPPVVEYVASPWPGDITAYALAAIVVLPPLLRRVRRGRKV